MSCGEVKKYDVAREYRKGMAYCISGGGLEPSQSEEWKDGWEYAYRNIRPQVNDATQDYIVEKGYTPFEQVQVMRTANDPRQTAKQSGSIPYTNEEPCQTFYHNANAEKSDMANSVVDDSTCPRCLKPGAHFVPPSMGEPGFYICEQNQQFKVGDIVEHISGQICNGRYGEIVIAYDDKLSVLDNEGALDMPVDGHEHELKVVGNIRDNSELLKIFVTMNVNDHE